MQTPRLILILGLLPMAAPPAATAQGTASRRTPPAHRSARPPRFLSQPRDQNWMRGGLRAVAKLLERRGAPGGARMVARDRTRTRGRRPRHPTGLSLEGVAHDREAAIVLDGDWADVSVPRCSGFAGGGRVRHAVLREPLEIHLHRPVRGARLKRLTR